MRTARALAVVLCIVIMAGFSVAQNAVPKDMLEKFPEDRFLHRLGTGETPEEASESARLEIAKFFEAKISGETLVRQWSQSTTSRGKTLENSLTELSNTVIVGANRDIPGIEIAGTKENRSRNNYEAWAVLDKSNYAGVLRERIRAIDNDVDSRIARNPETDIDRLRNLSSIMRSLVLRNRSRQDLLLLEPGAAVEPRDALLNDVMSQLDSLISDAFDVALVFNGDVKNDVRSGIVESAVNAGIRVKEYLDVPSSKSAGADLVLLVEHEVSPKTVSYRSRTFHNVDWTLSVRAADTATGAVIDALVLNDAMGGAQNEDQAEDRMVRKILTEQAPQISAWVYQVIFKPEE